MQHDFDFCFDMNFNFDLRQQTYQPWHKLINFDNLFKDRPKQALLNFAHSL